MISPVAGLEMKVRTEGLLDKPSSISNILKHKKTFFAARISLRIPVAGICVRTILLIATLVASVPEMPGSEADGRYAILLSGASGDEDLQKIYLDEIRKLHSILVGPLGFAPEQVVTLFDNPEMDPALIQRPSTRKELEEVVKAGTSKVDTIVSKKETDILEV